MANQGNIIVSEDYKTIKSFFETKSKVLYEYIEEHKNSEFTLIHKHLSYADLLSKAKRKNKDDSFDLDILMYLTSEELKEIEAESLGITKQSNITMPSIFYEKLGIKQLKRRSGKQATQHNHILINDYAKVYLVNESYKYFEPSYTFAVLNKLHKLYTWSEDDLKIELSNSDFTEIDLHHAIHGIGTKDDKDFHKLRHSFFRNDNIICLIENNNGNRNLYIYLEKNTKFHLINGTANEHWLSYLDREEAKCKKQLKNDKTNLSLYDEEKTRKQQNKWRSMLAEEVMNYTTHDGEVFCAFTMITSNFEYLGTLYRASHIKRYENCTTEEAFDLNNGLLLTANADALFDKFLITVDENKELVFSFEIDKNYLLKQQLMLDRPIFKLLLNDQRMEYMKWHREQFYKKEEERKK